MRPIKGAKGQC